MPPTVLLREARREGKRIIKRTLANLSHWSQDQVQSLRLLLRGETLVPAAQADTTEASWPHGNVQAVLGTLRQLGLEKLISSTRCPCCDQFVARIAAQILHADSKLAYTRLWHTNTLAEELGVGACSEEDLYRALDWLWARQRLIERKLAVRHLEEGATAFYDVSSSYYYGRHCPLAQHGHDRDGKQGLPIITYGVLADQEGRPISVQVYPGNTGDPTTVPDQAAKLQQDFGWQRVVLVGDRGMLTHVQIERFRQRPGLGWVSALRSGQIRSLVPAGDLQMSLFDEVNLAEITSEQYPGERLIGCDNPLLAEERRRKRAAWLAASEEGLARIVREVARRTRQPLSEADIGAKVGRVWKRYRMGKHFRVHIGPGRLDSELAGGVEHPLSEPVPCVARGSRRHFQPLDRGGSAAAASLGLVEFKLIFRLQYRDTRVRLSHWSNACYRSLALTIR